MHVDRVQLDTFIEGDALQTLRRLPDECVDCVVTSPPYFALRDYGVRGQLGTEQDLEEYLSKLVAVFEEVRRVLKPTGTCWVNLGDTYGTASGRGIGNAKQLSNRGTRWLATKGKLPARGLEKCLLQIPSRFSIAMADRGWILRNEIIWQKPNCMPQPVRDRFTVDFEKVFLFVKSPRYFFEQQFEPMVSSEYDIRRMRSGRKVYHGKWSHSRGGSWNGTRVQCSEHNAVCRNKRAVWTIATQAYRGAHFATFPEALVEIPIKAGCPPGGIVLDPFMGSGTTAAVARRLGRRFVGIELNPAYIELAMRRLDELAGVSHTGAGSQPTAAAASVLGTARHCIASQHRPRRPSSRRTRR